MKNILFLLLFSVSIYGQNPTPFSKIKITGNGNSTTATKVNVQESNGVVNTISKSSLQDVAKVTDFASLPATGEANKVYITLDNNKIFHWDGTAYVEVSAGGGIGSDPTKLSIINNLADLNNITTARANLGLGTLALSSATIPTTTSQLTNNSGFITSYTEIDPTVKAINGIVKSNGTTISSAGQTDVTSLLGTGSISNTMIANTAVASLSGTNSGDNATNTLYSGLEASKANIASPTFTGTVGLPAGQVVNGVTLSTLAGTDVFLKGDGTYGAPVVGSGTLQQVIDNGDYAEVDGGINYGSSYFQMFGVTDVLPSTARNGKWQISDGGSNHSMFDISNSQIFIQSSNGSNYSSIQLGGSTAAVNSTYDSHNFQVNFHSQNIRSKDSNWYFPETTGSNSENVASREWVDSQVFLQSNGDASGLTNFPILNQNTTGTASNVTGIVAVSNGGTGTATPSLVAGTNVTITGTFPNQTINSSGGVSSTNISYTPSTTTGTIASSTGTGATIPLADATNSGLFLASEKTKLAGISSGATANSPDATLLDRTNHTGTQLASTISNFSTATRSNISLTTTGTSGVATYNTATGIINIPNYASGGGGGVTGTGTTGKFSKFSGTSSITDSSALSENLGVVTLAGGFNIQDGTQADGSVLYGDSNGSTTWKKEGTIILYTSTNADFSAIKGGNFLPSESLTADRTITIPTGSIGEKIEIYNKEQSFTWFLAGQPVYLSDGTTVVTSLLANTNYIIRFTNKWEIIN